MSNKKGCVLQRTQKDLLLSKGLTVSARVHGRVTLVGADQNTIQSAEVGAAAVVSALLNGAFNALVGLTIHCHFLLFGDVLSMEQFFCSIRVFLIDI